MNEKGSANPIAAGLSTIEVDSFGLDLLGRIAAMSPGNVVVAPLCIAQALVLAAIGAPPTITAAIYQTLRCHWFTAEQIERWHADVRKCLDASGIIRMAAACWTDIDFLLPPKIEPRLAALGADAMSLDFRNSTRAAQTVNDWVSVATDGLITQLASSSDFSDPSRHVLTTATFLRGDWSVPFKRDQTRPRWFWSDLLRGGFLPTMHRLSASPGAVGDIEFHEDAAFTAVRLGYKSAGDIALVFDAILPRRGVSLDAACNALKASYGRGALFADSDEDAEPVDVDLRLPRLQIMQTLELKPILVAMGLGPAADMIGAVRHAARAQIDEKGTIAAAATILNKAIIAPMHYRPPRHRRVRFYATRPFLWTIREETTGALLFAGIFREPASDADAGGARLTT